MLSNIPLVSSPLVDAIPTAVGEMKPETGEFNFMNYLLGLQVSNPTQEESGENLTHVLQASLPPPQSLDDPARALLDLLEKDRWMLPVEQAVMGPTPSLAMVGANLPEAIQGDLSGWGTVEDLGGKTNGSPLLSHTISVSIDKHAASNVDTEKCKSVVQDSEGSFPKPEAISVTMPEVKPQSMSKSYVSKVYGNQNAAAYSEAPYSESPRAVKPELLYSFLDKRSGVFSTEKTESHGSGDGSEMLSSILMPSHATSQNLVSHVETQAETVSTIPQLMLQVERLVSQGGGKMTVSLNPPELGHVEVEVTTRGKKVEVEIRSETDQARSLLETRLTDLKQSMQSHDLVVSKLEVRMERPSGLLDSAPGFSAATTTDLPNSQQDFSGNSMWARPQTVARSPLSNQGTMIGRSEIHRPVQSMGRVDLRI